LVFLREKYIPMETSNIKYVMSVVISSQWNFIQSLTVRLNNEIVYYIPVLSKSWI